MAKFKVGDIVKVTTNPRGYSITGIGAVGFVKEISGDKLFISFDPHSLLRRSNNGESWINPATRKQEILKNHYRIYADCVECLPEYDNEKFILERDLFLTEKPLTQKHLICIKVREMQKRRKDKGYSF